MSDGEVGRGNGQRTTLSVLIVEDDRVDSMILRELLERDGRFGPIRAVPDGEQALGCWSPKTAERPPDIVFLDINMPRMDGFEFLTEFEALPKDEQTPTRVVMLIGGLDPDRDFARAAQFSAVVGRLLKPFTSKALAALAETLTRLRPPPPTSARSDEPDR